MTQGQWLRYAQTELEKASVPTAHLDALILLEDCTGRDRSHLLAHPETTLTAKQVKQLQSWLKRRVKHEPLAYIRGKSEFYGREFMVNAHTLEPRPETETMIELLKQLVDSKQLTADSSLKIADVGTGSGAIGITVALEIPSSQVVLLDIDKKCIKIAGANAQKFNINVQFFQGDLLEPLLSTVSYKLSAILANLPYVPDTHTINEAAMYEPKHAIFGGPDGLDLYRRLFQQIVHLPEKPKYILTESLPFQHQQLAEIAQSGSYRLLQSEDFIQAYVKVDS